MLLLMTLSPQTVEAETKKIREGEAPPAVDWVSVAGDTLTWDGLREERPLVVVFWATWCTVCKKEWPKLQELFLLFADSPRAPAWASISLGEPVSEVARVAGERNVPGKLIADPTEKNGKYLGIRYIPTILVLDRDGLVAYCGKSDTKKLDRLLKKLTSESEKEETSR